MVLHAWEETLEGRFVADHFEQWWGVLIRRPQEEEGSTFALLINFLEDKKHFGGEDCNIPKI